MGVQNFYPFIAERAEDAIEYLDSVPDLTGVEVGIDVAFLLYRARTSIEADADFLPYLAEKLTWLFSLGAQVTMVFDGEHPCEKQEEQERRQKEKEKYELEFQAAETALKLLTSQSEIERQVIKLNNLRKRFAKPTQKDKADACKLFNAMGCYCYHADGEAESSLASLQLAGLIDEIVTDDSDTIVCGAKSILKNFWSLQYLPFDTSNLRRPQRVHQKKILENLCVCEQGLRIACVLAGCDFVPKEYHLKRVGLKVAVDRSVKRCGPSLIECIKSLKFPAICDDVDAMHRYRRALDLLTARRLEPGDIDTIRLTRVARMPDLKAKQKILERALKRRKLRIEYVPTQPLVPEEWLVNATASSCDPSNGKKEDMKLSIEQGEKSVFPCKPSDIEKNSKAAKRERTAEEQDGRSKDEEESPATKKIKKKAS